MTPPRFYLIPQLRGIVVTTSLHFKHYSKCFEIHFKLVLILSQRKQSRVLENAAGVRIGSVLVISEEITLFDGLVTPGQVGLVHANFDELVHVANEVRQRHIGLVQELVEVFAVEGKLAFVELVGRHHYLAHRQLSVYR